MPCLIIRQNYKKMEKKVNKNVKVVKPEIMVDCTRVNDVAGAYTAYIEAKARAGKQITIEEINMIKDFSATETIDQLATNVVQTFLSIPYTQFEVKDGEKLVFDENGNVSIKKPNIFKRILNWFHRK